MSHDATNEALLEVLDDLLLAGDDGSLGTTTTDVTDLDWKLSCEDCLAGVHERCRRRRRCACLRCDWRNRVPARSSSSRPSSSTSTKTRDASPRRMGKRATGTRTLKNGMRSVDDEICEAAADLVEQDPTRSMTGVAKELNVERSNLVHAMKRRGLR